jgi:hypothetical protein
VTRLSAPAQRLLGVKQIEPDNLGWQVLLSTSLEPTALDFTGSRVACPCLGFFRILSGCDRRRHEDHGAKKMRNRPKATLARKLLREQTEGTVMVIRFTESVRVRLWGRELSNFRKGEVHTVPTAVAGVLLAQGCAEPVPDQIARDLRRAS